MLIAIDDVHWADRASLRLVLYLLGRLDEMAVSFIVARRLGEPGAPDDLLAQIATHAASRAVRPPPLSRHGARRMVAAALHGADEAFGDACWRMTEGNVFLLQELIAAVRDEGWEPTAQNATRIGTLAPEAVLRAVSVRLMRLSDDAAGIARAVAVLGEAAQLRHVVALTGSVHDRVAAGADALAASDILRPLDTGALTFAHPLLASAVYADIATGERAALHRRAAEILHGERAAHERVAAHLLPTPGSGEAWVVEVLRAAARHALTTGRRSRRRATCGARSTSRPRRRARRAAARAGGERGDDRPAERDRAPHAGAATRAGTTRSARGRCSRSGAPWPWPVATPRRSSASTRRRRSRGRRRSSRRPTPRPSCSACSIRCGAARCSPARGRAERGRRRAAACLRHAARRRRARTCSRDARRRSATTTRARPDHGPAALFGIGLALRAGDDLARADG